MSIENEKVLANRFKVGPRIGSGGMAHIHRGEDLFTRRPVAIKILAISDGESENQRRLELRFEREADLLERLQECPNVVHFLARGVTDEKQPFIVMELIEGRPLRQILTRVGANFSPATFLVIAQQLVAGLKGIHSRRVLHRDLSPENVMVVRQPRESLRVKFLDFGVGKSLDDDLAHLTRNNTFLGRPAYYSPEAAAGEPLTAASDIYSLGVMFFEMITGRLPIDISSIAELPKLRRDAPRSLVSFPNAQRYPEELRTTVMACLEKEPDKRPTIDEVMECIAELSRRSKAGEDLGASFSLWELTKSGTIGDATGRLLQADRIFGPFDVRAHLGSGPRGEVWSCHDRRTGHDVAVKVLRDRESSMERTLDVARRAAALDHPHIAAIQDIDVVDGIGYVASTQIKGPSLASVIEEGGALPANRLLQIIQDVLSALEHAHTAGLVHGNLHPRNILTNEFDDAFVTDFGFGTSTVATDPFERDSRWVQCMAPELACGKAASPVSDVYSLGCLLFNMATGKQLYEGTIVQVLYRHANAEAGSPERHRPGLTPKGLVNLIANCLEKDPGDRPASIADVRADLDRAFSSPNDPLAVTRFVKEPKSAARGLRGLFSRK